MNFDYFGFDYEKSCSLINMSFTSKTIFINDIIIVIAIVVINISFIIVNYMTILSITMLDFILIFLNFFKISSTILDKSLSLTYFDFLTSHLLFTIIHKLIKLL